MKKNIIATALALPLTLSLAHAQENSGVRISGIGTAALTVADTDNAEFARSNQARGAGKDARTGVDSNLGLQADYSVNEWLSLTAQGLVRKDGADDFGAELSWAFAKLKLSDALSVRVGRIAMPAFMISDYRNVGYANTFLRPPQEVYSQNPLNGIDGADVTWQQEYANTTYTLQAAYGRSTVDMSTGTKAKAKGEYAVNLTAEHGPFTMRVGRSGTKFTADSAALDALVATFKNAAVAFAIPQLSDMGRTLDSRNQKYTFTSLGLGMDWNNIVAQTEFAKRKMPESFLGSSKAWYAMGGYRFGKVLPYYSYAKVISSGVTNTIPSACPANAAAACLPTVAGLSGIMDALRAGINGSSQNTHSIGVRWDFMPSADIKVQIDRIEPQVNGLFVKTQPGFKGPVTVGAVAVDFVF